MAVVPIQETEAWLLLDEDAIRFAAGNPNGKAQLDLPSPARVESVTDPKVKLQEALVAASEHSGRRLKRFRKRFSQQRRLLIERLDMDGPVSQVPAWKQLNEDVVLAINKLFEEGS